MKKAYAVFVTVLALLVSLIWSFMGLGVLSFIALVGWVSAPLTGQPSRANPGLLWFEFGINVAFVALWAYAVWLWRRVNDPAGPDRDGGQP
jgi:hypothetical protein